jgi:hypothetical protein
MKITEAMKKSGKWKLVNGEWVVGAAEAAAIKETVNLVEAQRRELGGHHDSEEPLGPGWVKVPVPDFGAQVSAFMRAGLSQKEAELAANPNKLFRGR